MSHHTVRVAACNVGIYVVWCEVRDTTSTVSYQCLSRSQTHVQWGSKRYFCCDIPASWSHFPCSAIPFPIARLIPLQKQNSALPVWHIHTPAADILPLHLRCPRNYHRQSAIYDHNGRLPHGLHTGFCHQQDEGLRMLGRNSRQHKQHRQHYT